MVFSKRFADPYQSYGILPTPQNSPIKDQQPKNYIGASLYPLPYQAVLVLEGCPFQNLLSWDISVSSKSIKVKIQWSSNLKSTDGCILREKIPKNLTKSLCLHDLARPLWYLSSSQDKVTVNFEWAISKVIPSNPSTVSLSSNWNISLSGPDSPKTPYNSSRIRNFDSG